MKNRTMRILAVAALLTAFSAGLGHSASFTYAKYRKEIKAGVLIFPNAAGVYMTRSPAPYVFRVLNQRTDITPQGWDFTNPLAPSRVTPEIIDRWSSAAGPAYNDGDPINREMGCYWEVKINAGLAELSQFDVLYLGLPGDVTLDREGREKLRKFVDAGGVLWIENCANTPTLDFFFAAQSVGFSTGSGSWAAAPNRLHPLVHRPHDLAWDEISRLGTDSNELAGRGVHSVGQRIVSFGPGGGDYFTTVIGLGGSTTSPVVAGSQYGSGHIVVSAEAIGLAVSAFGSTYYDNAGNLIRNGTYCPAERASLAPTEDVKAATDIVSWGSEHTTFHKNARHSGYSFDEIGAPLALKWNFDAVKDAKAPTSSSAAFLDDMVFYVDGLGTLFALDLSPTQDRDGDGNPDDGIRDHADGSPYDVVWAQPVGEPSSSPTTAYVAIGGGQYVPAVFIATISGAIYGFNALTGAALKGSAVIMKVAPYNLPVENKVVPAPTYFDGTVYAGDGNGYLWAVNLQDDTKWSWPQNASGPIGGMKLPPAVHSPTVGYFRNPITGSVDQLVYMATAGLSGTANGCIYSFPIKIYNEVLTPAPGIPGEYRVRKYQNMPIKTTGADPYRLYYTLPGGNQLEINPAAVSVKNIGTFYIDPNIFAVPAGASVVADYEVDWITDQVQRTYRQRIDVKTAIQNGVQGVGVLSTPSAAPNDTLYYATENGSFYAVIEDGWGITTKWRWYLGDPGVVDALKMMGQPKPVGSPAVGGDRVYFAVNSGSDAYILAFDADPVFRINVGGPIDPGRPVEVLQRDSMNAGSEPKAVTGAAEGTDTSRRRVAFKVNYEKGIITIENFLDPLSASQDLIVRFFPPTGTQGPGARVEQIHSAFLGSSSVRYDDYWNNLVWCLKVSDGTPKSIREITSSPTLMGGLLYFGGDDGRVHAVNVHRVDQMASKGTLLMADENLQSVWPDINQANLGGPVYSTVAGSQGNIAVTSQEGLAVLYNALTLIADSHRVLEVDASGQVVWSCDSTSTYTGTRLSGTSTPSYAANKIAFNRPAVARRVGTSNVLVADTGNNRVVLIDRAGNALCDITDFRDPNGILPPVKIEAVDPSQPNNKISVHKLNSPTDAWMWMTQGASAGMMNYHFLIADTGNYRVVEIEYRFDPATGKYQKDLVWATHTLEQGKRYRYISAQRYPKVGGGTETICVIENFVPQAGSRETTGGAIVTIDDATGLILANPSDPKDVDYGVRRYVDKTNGSAKTSPGQIRVANPTFFSREYRADGHFVDLIGDSRGLHVAEFIAGPPDELVATPTIYDARANGNLPLLVSHAQLLPSHNILVTNKASNLTAPTGAQGDVIEIAWDTPAAPNAWTKVWPPPGVDVGSGSSYALEQPSSAERLFQ